MDETTIEGGAPAAPNQARLLRAMTMAALAAILAVGAVLGLQPRPAEATPRALARGRPTATAPVDAAGGAKATPDDDPVADGETSASPRAGKRVTGRLNLNTATAAELMLLPGVGPAKAGRIVAWRQRHGTFRRVADLRRVKGFGFRTVKRLEPYLDIKGDTTLRAG